MDNNNNQVPDLYAMNEKSDRSAMKHAAQTAIDIQNACNLSGVIFTWAEVMASISKEASAQSQGTDWKNNHPINVLFANKVADMTGGSSIDAHGTLKYSWAYGKCQEMANSI